LAFLKFTFCRSASRKSAPSIGLWTKVFPRALNFIQKNNFSKLNYLILGRI